MKQALVAMSGGVDSCATAYLMVANGYDCIGATMLLHADKTNGCTSERDIQDAAATCATLGIPHRVVELTDEFDRYVIKNFIEAYENGLTPNPCIECNLHLKFDKLLEYARENGYDYIATGHYARVEYDEKYGRCVLKKALDLTKDQSYVLWRLSQEKLQRVIFPLGAVESKTKTREIAEKIGLDISRKKESQDICFVPNGDYAKFIEDYTGKTYPPGDFVRFDGKYLGKHKGIIRYTIGQRKGLGLALDRSMYVVEKDLLNNRIIIGDTEHLMKSELWARDVCLSAVDTLDAPVRVKAKIRYNQRETDATAVMENGLLHVTFDEPQRAISKGQSVVLYDGDVVLGGGIIV